jgi:hypothetical protein
MTSKYSVALAGTVSGGLNIVIYLGSPEGEGIFIVFIVKSSWRTVTDLSTDIAVEAATGNIVMVFFRLTSKPKLRDTTL